MVDVLVNAWGEGAWPPLQPTLSSHCGIFSDQFPSLYFPQLTIQEKNTQGLKHLVRSCSPFRPEGQNFRQAWFDRHFCMAKHPNNNGRREVSTEMTGNFLPKGNHNPFESPIFTSEDFKCAEG